MQQFSSTNEEKVEITYAPQTAAGNPAEVENVTIELTSGDCEVSVDEATKTLTWVSGTGGLNAGLIKMDADLGEGVAELVEEFEYFVSEAQATSMGLGAAVVSPK